MRLLAQITEPVLLTYIESLLRDADIAFDVADRHISMMEGSIGAFPRRVLVQDEDLPRARRVLEEADLGRWIVKD
jgi:hypothetical protein